MALIKCPECKKKISDTVVSCPNCGYELKEEDKIEKKNIVPKIFICILTLVVISSGCLFSYKWYENQRIKEQERIEKEKRADEFVSNIEKYIDSEEEFISVLKQMVTANQEVWRNCILEIDGEWTDKYTKNKNGKFFSDFNDALEKYGNSDRAKKIASEVGESENSYAEYYNKIVEYKCQNRQEEDVLEVVKKINETIKNLSEYYLDYGYTYQDYEETTGEYFDELRELSSQLDTEIEDIE